MKRFFCILSLLALAGCFRNPITQRREAKLISEKTERSIGEQTKKKILEEEGEFKDPFLSAYVTRVGKRLAAMSDRPKVAYEFTILDTDLVNAFAAPGGFIFVTRGLLEQVQDEAELAAVLGHEIAHVAGWHSIGMIQKQMGLGALVTLGSIASGLRLGPEAMMMVAQTADLFSSLYLLGYSREHELEADRVGIRYMNSAGYDPRAALTFFGRLSALEKQAGPDPWESYLRSHPPTDERIRQAEKILNEGRVARRKTERGEIPYQEVKARLPRPKSEERGQFAGQVFTQPLYGIRLTLPEGWVWEGQSARALVSFRREQGEAWGELRREAVGSSTSAATAEDYAHDFVARRKWQFGHGRPVLYPAGYGYMAQFYGSGILGGTYIFRGYFVLRDGAAWTLLCAALPDRALDYLVPCEQIQRSLELK